MKVFFFPHLHGQHPSAAYGGNILFFTLVFFTLVFLSGVHL
jgi:hypothetical protein